MKPDPTRPRVLCLPTGPDEYAATVVRALARVADVSLMAPSAFLDRYGDDLPGSVRCHAVPWPRHRDPRGLALAMAAMRVAGAVAPDVIHFLGDSVVWLTLALPWLRRLPLVVTVHDVAYHPGDEQSRRVPMAMVRYLRRSADAIIVHGPRLRRDLGATGICPPGGVHVVPHPVLDRYRRLARRRGLERRRPEGDAPMILFFGRVMAYKGLILLIEASDQVVATVPSARFVVAGRGPDLDRWRSALAARPWFEVRDRYIPDEEAAQLFLDADVVALPYVEASQSGVAALAAGSGLPVVATDVGELGELVRGTEMGLVVAPRAAELAAALIKLLTDCRELHARAMRAAQAAEGVLLPSAAATRIVKIYRNVMQLRCQGACRYASSRSALDVIE